MGKWLKRLNEKFEIASEQEVTKLTKGSFGTSDSTESKHSQNSEKQLQRLHQQHKACLAVKTWPHYKTMSPEIKVKGDEIIKRLASEVNFFKIQSDEPI